MKKFSTDAKLSEINDKELSQEVREFISVSVTMNDETTEKDTMPYGEISAKLTEKDDKITLILNDKEYNLEDLLQNVQTYESKNEKEELIDIVSEQQTKIESQVKEISNLEKQRGNINEI